MIDMNAIAKASSADITSVSDWCEKIYQTSYAPFFREARELFKDLQTKKDRIPDSDLEWILVTLPMKLFDASAELSATRVSYETVKLGSKKKESEFVQKAVELGMKQSEAKVKAADSVIDDKILIAAYGSVIERVESEMSFCRELIMSAKKIWDARRKSDLANPVSEVKELPEYNPDKPKDYIKGV